MIGYLPAVLAAQRDFVGGNALYNAVFIRADHDAGVDSGFILHTRADDRRFGDEQRHRLLLHVRAHQRARVVVVFKEGDHRGRDRHHHFGRNVHKVGAGRLDLDYLGARARGDALFNEAVFLVERLVCLRDDIVILHIGGHVHDLVGDHACFVIDAAIGRFDEAVIVYARVGGKIRDKPDVRAFRRFDRTHTPVVGIVHVAHLKAGAVAAQTAGAERRQAALVSQLGKRVVLVHELRQRRASEEFAYRGEDRAYVDKLFGRDGLVFLDRHALLDDLVHA